MRAWLKRLFTEAAGFHGDLFLFFFLPPLKNEVPK